jgi:hypothetical protein
MYSITKQQYSSDLWPLSLKAKRNCIVDKSLKIIKLIIKNAVRLILDNFGTLFFLFRPYASGFVSLLSSF